MTLGFSNAALPTLLALERSHAADPVETDLKRLFLDLFRSRLAARVFDANALGMPHLGSFDLVRRAVNADGLALLPGSREEAATRYLYRAWKSRNAQGRGLHFLRTYLQMLFPNGCEVRQLWHNQDHPYPRGLVAIDRPRAWWLHQLGEPDLRLDGRWGVGERVRETDLARASDPIRTDGLFLTSRIDIAVDFSVEVPSIAGLLHIVRSIIPARLVPSFSFLMGVDALASAALVSSLQINKSLSARFGWPGCVIGEGSDASWRLGVDGAPLRLPRSAGVLKIDRFKLGERRGGASSWRIKSGRIESSAVLHTASDALTAGLPRLGDAWRRLDSSWRLGLRSVHASRSASMFASSEIVLPSSIETSLAERVRMDLQGTPDRLGHCPQLTLWRQLDGHWSVGAASRSFGFPIRRDEAVPIDSTALIEKRFDIDCTLAGERLPNPAAIQLGHAWRRLDGSWFLGAGSRLGRFRLDGRKLRAGRLTRSHRIGGFKVSHEIVGVTRYEAGPGRRLRLDGGWSVGCMTTMEVSIEIFKPIGA